ncbi:MAG: nitrilase-related carbon-nitrogen hydrolase, partial [Gaiellales bacterium]
MSDLRAACVQFCAGPDKGRNIERMEPLVERAAALGADLVLLPEKWNAVADGLELARHAESLEGGETVEALSDWARRHGILLICGSIAIHQEEGGVGNVSIAFDREGRQVAHYTKIHLFDVDVGGFSYRESDGTAPGEHPVIAQLDGLSVGLTVCYDLR